MQEERRQGNEVILAKLDGFRELFEEHKRNVDTTLARIEVQTIKTNGRVTALEMVGAEAKGSAKNAGILWGGVVSIAVSVVAFFINKQVS